MIGSAQSAHLVDSVILSRHTACLAPPNVAILRMYTSSESHFLLPAKRLALRMGLVVAAGLEGLRLCHLLVLALAALCLDSTIVD